MLKTIDYDKTVTTEWYFDEMKAVLDRIDREPIYAAIDTLHQARMDGKQVFIMGNGGSASTASHM
ncbi:MAG TPA: SIS domain-containing protein, partial [Promineifilum sp.]|nr:SIS domain-containing protein [Promineifilum sp.]